MKDFLQAVVYATTFLVLCVPLLVNDSMFFPFITGKNFTFRILVEIAFVSWALLALLDTAYRPRFSWILVSSGTLIAVMLLASLGAEHVPHALWSNFERMDGYVTLVHFFLYFLVLGHILTTRALWRYFMLASVGVATYIALYGLAQSVGTVDAKVRVDSTLGNAAYMAIYMLFHIFFVLFLMLQSKRDWIIRGLYGLVLALFVYILLETGTRGTFIGFITGGAVSVAYMALFGRGYPEVRKIAIGGFIGLFIFLGAFFVFRDSSVIQQNEALGRIANISLSDLTVRTTIWAMALEGVKERPLLGWGQGNFNYVFNAQYNPSLYAQEQWFDRVHNIFFDWLIAGGVLGFVAYFSILISALYYLFWRPLFHHDTNNDDSSFTVLERALLLGILAGYFTHNLVVFDNIVSYTFYAIVLALIHVRVATPIARIERINIHSDVITMIGVPVAIVSVVAFFYFVHLPGIMTAHDIIDAFRADTVDGRFEAFNRALERNSFGRQEVVEQMTQQTMALVRQPNVANTIKEKYVRQTEKALKDLIAWKPNDARLHVFFAGFYRSIGQVELAQEQTAIAHALSPQKQTIILEQGISAYQAGDLTSMRDFLKGAYELDPRFDDARVFYAAALLMTGDRQGSDALITPEFTKAFIENDFAIAAANQVGAYDWLILMAQARVEKNPESAQERAGLAFAYYKADKLDEAIVALEAGIKEVPSFATSGECYLKNMKAGKEPDLGC